MGHDDSQDESHSDRPHGATHLLPIVRAAMARGDGPTAVPAWVRHQGHAVGRTNWTPADETLARALATRLAATIENHRLNNLGTVRFLETVK